MFEAGAARRRSESLRVDERGVRVKGNEEVRPPHSVASTSRKETSSCFPLIEDISIRSVPQRFPPSTKFKCLNKTFFLHQPLCLFQRSVQLFTLVAILSCSVETRNFSSSDELSTSVCWSTNPAAFITSNLPAPNILSTHTHTRCSIVVYFYCCIGTLLLFLLKHSIFFLTKTKHTTSNVSDFI